jgi:ribose transport system permease protein
MSSNGGVSDVRPDRSLNVRRAVGAALGTRAVGLAVVTGIMLIILAIQVPSYVSVANLQLVGLQVTEVGIVAVGATVLMISGNVDLSVGSITGLVAVASSLIALSLPEPFPILLGVVIGMACGLFNGILVWRVRISPIIVTIGTLSLFYGISLVLNSGVAVTSLPASFDAFGSTDVFGFSIGFAIFVVLSVLTGFFLTLTRPGRQIYAVGGSSQAAARVGIRIRRLVVGSYVVNGLLTGLGGVLLASRFGSGDPTFGTNLEIDVITAVILGGVSFSGGEGGMGGVFMAVIFLGVLESGIVALNVSPYWTSVVEGAALVVAVVLQQVTREQRERRQRAVALAEEHAGGAATPRRLSPVIRRA